MNEDSFSLQKIVISNKKSGSPVLRGSWSSGPRVPQLCFVLPLPCASWTWMLLSGRAVVLSPHAADHPFPPLRMPAPALAPSVLGCLSLQRCGVPALPQVSMKSPPHHGLGSVSSVVTASEILFKKWGVPGWLSRLNVWLWFCLSS